MFVPVAGVALAGILAVLHSCLDLKATIGGSQYHHILYFLTPAMKPRMLMTVEKDMNLLPVSVRVGQAVDVVAQVGNVSLFFDCMLDTVVSSCDCQGNVCMSVLSDAQQVFCGQGVLCLGRFCVMIEIASQCSKSIRDALDTSSLWHLSCRLDDPRQYQASRRIRRQCC